MKLSLKVLILVICFALIANAETKFGLQVGANIGKFNVENSDWQGGYNIGVIAETKLYNHIFLLYGLNYINRGGTLKNISSRLWDLYRDFEVMEFDLKFKAGFVEIPLTLMYKFNLNEELSISPVIGCAYSIPTADYSKGNLKKSLYYYTGNPDDPNRSHYMVIKYIAHEEIQSTSNIFSTLFGLNFIYLNYMLQVDYNYDLSAIEASRYTGGIHEKMVFFSVRFSYFFEPN